MLMNKMKHSLFLVACLISFCGISLSNPPKLLIKIPTRQRPDQFFRVLDMYYAALSGKIPYSFLISCDIDDKTMNNPDVIARLSTYKNLFCYFNYNKSKVEAYNADMDNHMDFDLLLVTSDDTKPMQNYDEIIAEVMVNRFPDFDGVLNFNDGHQKQNLNTLPVIGKNFYLRFGYIYHPVYKAYYCDEELTLVSKWLGKEVYDSRVIILHVHPDWNLASFDDLYMHNAKFESVDHGIFLTRKQSNFYLK